MDDIHTYFMSSCIKRPKRQEQITRTCKLLFNEQVWSK